MKVFKLYLSITALFALFILGSCSDDDPEPNNTLMANAGPDQDVIVGQVVFLDGTASSDSNGGSFQYDWEILSSPAGSIALLNSNSIAEPFLTPDFEGTYDIELRIFNSDGLEDTDRVTITATNSSDIVIINDDIDTDMTLTNRIAEPGVPDYCITESIEISGVLTIEPGVVIAVATNVSVLVNDGVFIANGTAENPIIFKAKTAGQKWKGLAFLFSDDFRNRMNYVTIADGGADIISIIDQKAALSIASFSSLNITNSTIDASANEGIYFDKNSEINSFDNNVVKNSAGVPLIVSAEQLGQLDELSDFSQGNNESVVEVIDGEVSLNDRVFWKRLAGDVPYLIKDNVRIQSEVNINAGVKFLFEADRYIEINGDDAVFIVNGTADSPVQFLAADPTEPWRGIAFILANDARNSINYAEISNAGIDIISIADREASLIASSFSKFSVSNTTVKNSVSNGIYVSDDSDIILFSKNRMEANEIRPLVMPAHLIEKLDDQSMYSLSNGKDEIEIFESEVNLAEVSTWSAPTDGTPFVITGDVEIESGLIIEPNVRLLFDSNTQMLVSGYLTAVANADNERIVFSSYNQNLPWKGLGFISDDVRNELNFVEVSHAGSDIIFNAVQRCNVWVNSFDKLKMFNSIISNGGGYGLVVDSDGSINEGASATAVENSNSFSNNTEGNVLIID